MSAIACSAVEHAAEFAAQGLANTVWAFATLGVLDQPLVGAIAAEVTLRSSTFTSQGLTNTAWAFASVGFRNKPLMEAIAEAALRTCSQLIPQEVANLAWSCAKIGFAREHFLSAIGNQAAAIVSEFVTQDLSNTVWACATLLYDNARLVEAISTHSVQKLHLFLNQELSNTAWAVSKLQRTDRTLRAAMAAEVRGRLASLDAQALSNLSDSVPDMSDQLLARLEPFLDAFVAGMPKTLPEWSGAGFHQVLHQTGVDNFGIAGSNRLLMKMGIPTPSADFIDRARRRVEQAIEEGDARQDTWGLVHKRVLCYGEWDIRLPDGQALRGALLRENGIRVGHAAPPVWLKAFATPINSLIGRDLCGEFQLTTGIGLILDSAPPGQLLGEVCLFSTSTPCCSCIAVLRQLQLRFTELRVMFANGENFG